MRKLLTAVLLALLASAASAEVTVRDGKFWFNGERQERVIGRSSFKLANIVSYHYAGQGGGKYSLGYARRWVEHNQAIFGKHVVLRVFLETAGWSPCDQENGVPENCMFGSEPRDKGFWNNAGWDVGRERSNRDPLRDGARETAVHTRGQRVLEWFFETSEETGVAFELTFDATLKHDEIPAGEIDHVIRQLGVLVGEFQRQYPNALIIPNLRNEIFAHNQSGHTLDDVNMWAVRWDRDEYTPSWRAPITVDQSGVEVPQYRVGPEDGHFRAALIHPDRGGGWEQFPNERQLRNLRESARGMPFGFNESMYYIEPEEANHVGTWYGRGGVTTNWPLYRQFLEHAIPKVDYFIIHDEKGVQCDLGWPRAETRLEAWAREYFNTGPVEPPPDPPPDPPPPTNERPKVTVTGPDTNGVRYVRVEFPGIWPRVVKGDTAEDAVTEVWDVDLPDAYSFYAAGSFIGTDRGDLGEYAVTIASRNGPIMYGRSLHMQQADAFDSEDWKPANFVTTDRLRIWIVARTTGPNNDLRPGQPWTSRPDFVVHLWTYTGHHTGARE